MTTVESPALARDRYTRANPLWQVAAEVMKIRTTRLWWLFLAGVVLVTAWALLRNGAAHHYELNPPLDQYPPNERAGAAAAAVHAATDAGRAAIAADMMTSGQILGGLLAMLLGGLLAMLLGTLVVTSEYAHQTAPSTFLANPHRGAVIGAKVVATIVVGVVLWGASTVFNLLVAPFYLGSQHIQTPLIGWVPLKSVLLNLLVYVMWGVFGSGWAACSTARSRPRSRDS